MAIAALAVPGGLANAQSPGDVGLLRQQLEARDELIAQQEALLNTYRCRFGIDITAVPGGCSSGQPTRPAAPPGNFEGTPTNQDITARDQLIADQENLLNAYRCQHNIDTHIVTGGCPEVPHIPSSKNPDTSQTVSTQPGSVQYTAIAAAGYRTCAIRTDGTIDCWGGSLHANAPTGQYTAISASGIDRQDYFCAIRTDGTIDCWGSFGPFDSYESNRIYLYSHTEYQQLDQYRRSIIRPVPHSSAGRYTAIAVDNTICAVRTDQTIACWGHTGHGQADPPAGQYTAIATGQGHSCAIRTDGTIDCWGSRNVWWPDADLIIDPPAGQYTAIAAGDYHSCAIGTDQTINCWGWLPSERDYHAPAGQYTAIATSNVHSCAIRTDGTIDCWGHNRYGQTDAPAGQYTAIATGDVHSCAIRTDGTIDCWGNNVFGWPDAPAGPYTDIVIVADNSGSHEGCAIRTDGTIDCWGDEYTFHRRTPPPAGQYTAFFPDNNPDNSINNNNQDNYGFCTIRIDGTIDCGGRNIFETYYATGGPYTDIAVAEWFHDTECAIRTDGTIDCWEPGIYSGFSTQLDAPAGQYTAIEYRNTINERDYCAVRTDGTIVCWQFGPEWRGYGPEHEDFVYRPLDGPAGQYTAIAATLESSCAIRTDQTIACWDLGPAKRADEDLDLVYRPLDGPAGQYTAIASYTNGYTRAREQQGNALSDEFGNPLVYALFFYCAVRTDQTIACWDFGPENPGRQAPEPEDLVYRPLDVPAGQYTALPTSGYRPCAIRTDGNIVCWEFDPYRQLDAPAGQYTAIDADGSEHCAVRTDGNVRCWRIPMPLNFWGHLE
ncbi:RCC1 domain-containing protein [Candidatus Poriferisocius sp.]|uniref:RCC1 domain-containing protein n=1 Tax=Candidatus Poriferisocius sp. TaxID=3101276 RepID=UPI003B5AB50B